MKKDPFTLMTFAKDILKGSVEGPPPKTKTRERYVLERLAEALEVATMGLPVGGARWNEKERRYDEAELNDEVILLRCIDAVARLKHDRDKSRKIEDAIDLLARRFLPNGFVLPRRGPWA